jgi:hypothetical protein
MRSMAMLFVLTSCTTSNPTPINPAETCTSAVCPLGGHTYKFCSTAGATACRYLASDGQSFKCNSCKDCSGAAMQIANWCSTGGGTTTSGTTSSGTTTSGTTTSGTTSGSTTSGTTGGQPLNGCNGLLNCYINCNQTNPVQSCFDACDAGATSQALTLLNNFGSCIDTNCYQATNADSGMPYCDPNSPNPTSSSVCNDCYNRILGTNGVCHSAQVACTNDKP